MFCHNCGKALVPLSRFCSWCGTAVPPQVWEPAPQGSDPVIPEPLAPVPEGDSQGSPAPRGSEPQRSEPEKSELEKSAAGTSAPEDDAPEAVRQEEAAPQESAPDMPEAGEAAPDQAPAGLPGAADADAPPVPEGPARAPEKEAVLPPEKIVLPLSVTQGQIVRGEAVVLRHEALCEPMELVLRGGMKDGMKLRLTNAPLKPSPSGAERSLVVELCVAPSEESPAPEKVARGEAPAAERAVPERPSAAEGAAPEKPAPAQRPAFDPVDAKCVFQLTEGAERRGYRFGGVDDEGVVVIEPGQITLFKKNKAIGMAFGLVGRLLEGRGKQFAVIRREDVGSFEKETKRSGQCVYRMRLKDGRLFKLAFSSAPVQSALDKLLAAK